MQVLFLLFLVTFVSASPLSEVSKIVLSEQLKDNFLFNRKIFSQEGQQNALLEGKLHTQDNILLQPP
jgi:hypothetical protein